MKTSMSGGFRVQNLKTHRRYYSTAIPNPKSDPRLMLFRYESALLDLPAIP